MFGFPPSGRRMRVWGVNFFRMEDDKIAERWGQFDVLTMMQQLGLAPGPPTPEAPEEGPEYGDPHRAGQRDAADIEANKAVYRRMVEEIVNQGKFEVVQEIFHPDYVDHVAPPGTTPGLAGVEEIFTMFRTGFPDVKFHIDQMVGEGNYVATLVHGEGTQTGQFIQFPPSGKHAVWRSVGFFRVEDGLIREHWGIPDLLGLLIQIGIIPPPDAQSAARARSRTRLMSAESNRALIQRFYDEGWNANNLDVYDELVTDDFVDHQAVPGLPPGREGSSC